MALETLSVGLSSALPRVLVLLASRNGATAIERQIDSVLAQAGVDVTLDVRDDGSSDATRDVVAGIAARDARVRLLDDHAPSGSAAGNFFALMRAASLDTIDYIAFCDQDDEWLPHKLSRGVALMRASGSAGYSSATLAVWPSGRRRVQSQNTRTRHADHLFEGAGQGCTFMFDVDLFRRLRDEIVRQDPLLPGIHYHDWCLFALARASGANWHFDSEPTLIYHQHGGNDTGARSSGEGISRRLAMIRSGWYRGQVSAIVRLVRSAAPAHVPAIEWERLSQDRSARVKRLVYVLRHGRRRVLDRLIQAGAAALGYL